MFRALERWRVRLASLNGLVLGDAGPSPGKAKETLRWERQQRDDLMRKTPVKAGHFLSRLTGGTTARFKVQSIRVCRYPGASLGQSHFPFVSGLWPAGNVIS